MNDTDRRLNDDIRDAIDVLISAASYYKNSGLIRGDVGRIDEIGRAIAVVRAFDKQTTHYHDDGTITVTLEKTP